MAYVVLLVARNSATWYAVLGHEAWILVVSTEILGLGVPAWLS